MTTPQQQPKAGTAESLMLLSVPQLKEKCKALGTPVTGVKTKLVAMILNPSSNQKKRATAGTGIKKKKAAPKKAGRMTVTGVGGFSGYGGYGGYGGFGGFGGFGSDEDDDDGEYCDGCDEPSDMICPRTGLCPECQCEDDERAVASGVCPGCLKRCPPCEFDEDEGCYECEM